MTALLDTELPSVVDVLRGERGRRPQPDLTAAGGLRAQLEDGIFTITGGRRRDRAVSISTSTLLRHDAVATLASSPLGRLRGALVGELARLLCVGAPIDHPYDDALSAWRSHSSGELVVVQENLDHDDCARLTTDVESHFTTLRRALGDQPHRFQPRSAVRMVQLLAGGDVVIRDVIDLMFGSTATHSATVVLLDVTTTPLGAQSDSTIGYHALLQTLRTSIVPLRSAIFSSATGELCVRDVDTAMLQRSVDDVLTAVEREWKVP